MPYRELVFYFIFLNVYILLLFQFDHLRYKHQINSIHYYCCLYRKTTLFVMCRLRSPEPRPVHPSGGTRSRMACSVPKVSGVQTVPGWELYVLCARRQNLLQAGLCKVRSSLMLFFFGMVILFLPFKTICFYLIHILFVIIKKLRFIIQFQIVRYKMW